MKRGKWFILLMIILAVGLILTGCGSKNEPAKNPASQEGSTPVGPPALNVAHESRDNCAMCHANGAMLTNVKPNHVIDNDTPTCSACHKLNFK
jgi:hypothetical protein